MILILPISPWCYFSLSNCTSVEKAKRKSVDVLLHHPVFKPYKPRNQSVARYDVTELTPTLESLISLQAPPPQYSKLRHASAASDVDVPLVDDAGRVNSLALPNNLLRASPRGKGSPGRLKNNRLHYFSSSYFMTDPCFLHLLLIIYSSHNKSASRPPCKWPG